MDLVVMMRCNRDTELIECQWIMCFARGVFTLSKTRK